MYTYSNWRQLNLRSNFSDVNFGSLYFWLKLRNSTFVFLQFNGPNIRQKLNWIRFKSEFGLIPSIRGFWTYTQTLKCCANFAKTFSTFVFNVIKNIIYYEIQQQIIVWDSAPKIVPKFPFINPNVLYKLSDGISNYSHLNIYYEWNEIM